MVRGTSLSQTQPQAPVTQTGEPVGVWRNLAIPLKLQDTGQMSNLPLITTIEP